MAAKIVGGSDARIPGNIIINTPGSVPTKLPSYRDRQRPGYSPTSQQSFTYFTNKISDAEVRNKGQGDTGRDKSTCSYSATQLSPVLPAFQFLDAQDPNSAPDLLYSFAPDLANLVMADYPFKMSVSDSNLLHASINYITDSYSTVLFGLDTLNQV